jgi:hypothetical protein
MSRRADPCRDTPTRPTLDAVQQRVGVISRALFAVHDMSLAVEDGDSTARRYGALAAILAEQLDRVWLDLDGLVAARAVDADDQEP